MPTRMIASSAKASGLAASVSPARMTKRQRDHHLQSPQGEQGKRDSEGEGGNAAERTTAAQTTANVRLDQRAVGPIPGPARPRGECGDRDGDNREHTDPEQRSERVVEQAVRDEAVAARVPEVVPELEAVVQEQCALVRVRREVAAGRAEPRERCGEQRGCGRRGQRFEREWRRLQHCCPLHGHNLLTFVVIPPAAFYPRRRSLRSSACRVRSQPVIH